MHCLYCRHWNPEDEPRCQRCARRLQSAPARSAPEGRASSYSWTAAATAPALDPVIEPVTETVEPARAEVVAEAPPQRTQVPRQTRLFTEGESGKVLQF